MTQARTLAGGLCHRRLEAASPGAASGRDPGRRAAGFPPRAALVVRLRGVGGGHDRRRARSILGEDRVADACAQVLGSE